MADLSFDDFKVPQDEIEPISSLLYRLTTYRNELNYFFNDNRKIRCRLFYKNDDLPPNLWSLDIPMDEHEHLKWVAHLLTEPHFARVGVYELFDDGEDIVMINDPRFAILFEDPNDLLTFKLTVPR